MLAQPLGFLLAFTGTRLQDRLSEASCSAAVELPPRKFSFFPRLSSPFPYLPRSAVCGTVFVSLNLGMAVFFSSESQVQEGKIEPLALGSQQLPLPELA